MSTLHLISVIKNKMSLCVQSTVLKEKKVCSNLHKDKGVNKENIFMYFGAHPSGCVISGDDYTEYSALICL
jgi:hypothetical protein